MTRTRPLFSICIPVLNEERNILPLFRELQKLSSQMQDLCNFEFIFTDNASTDDTWAELNLISQDDNRVRAFQFVKNIGFQNSILFAYRQSRGDVVAQIDADLQDPPELLLDFYKAWETGALVVNGIRKVRTENVLLATFRKAGYWFLDKLSEHPITRNAGDFRLLDRQVVDALNAVKIPNPYLRGIVSGFGFKTENIHYERSARLAGKSKFGVIEIIKLGWTGFSNHSNLPLRLASFTGVFSLLISAVGSIYFISMKFLHPDIPRGFVSVYVLILFGIGINSLFLSVIGNYIRRIYEILKGEPVILVSRSIDQRL
jgi:polyisoprenyl-phosphate glycosyltransferase